MAELTGNPTVEKRDVGGDDRASTGQSRMCPSHYFRILGGMTSVSSDYLGTGPRPSLHVRLTISGRSARLDTVNLSIESLNQPALGCPQRTPTLPGNFRPSVVACPKNGAAKSGHPHSGTIFELQAISKNSPILRPAGDVVQQAHRRDEHNPAL